MEDIVFTSERELHQRLMPAIRTRINSLKKTGYSYITEDDLWEALSNKWNEEQGLELCDMVDDILNEEETKLLEYLHKTKNELVVMDTIIDLPKLK